MVSQQRYNTIKTLNTISSCRTCANLILPPVGKPSAPAGWRQRARMDRYNAVPSKSKHGLKLYVRANLVASKELYKEQRNADREI